MRRINKSALQVISENAKEANNSIREYVECESQSDPGFFRWFFKDDSLEDFENPDAELFEKWLSDNDYTFTYDVIFNDDNSSDNKGFKECKEYCINYIKSNNGTSESYFENYKGGTVDVICNETGDVVYSETVK